MIGCLPGVDGDAVHTQSRPIGLHQNANKDNADPGMGKPGNQIPSPAGTRRRFGRLPIPVFSDDPQTVLPGAR